MDLFNIYSGVIGIGIGSLRYKFLPIEYRIILFLSGLAYFTDLLMKLAVFLWGDSRYFASVYILIQSVVLTELVFSVTEIRKMRRLPYYIVACVVILLLSTSATPQFALFICGVTGPLVVSFILSLGKARIPGLTYRGLLITNVISIHSVILMCTVIANHWGIDMWFLYFTVSSFANLMFTLGVITWRVNPYST